MPPRWQNAVQAICHAPLHPIGAQVTGHIPMSVRRGPPDRPHSHGGQTRPRKAATPHGSRTGSRGPATPPRQPDGALGPGHTPTAARRRARNRPHDLGRQTMPRGPAMPRATTLGPTDLLRPTATTRGPGNRLQPHGDHQGTAHIPRRPDGNQEAATHPPRPDGNQEAGHTPTATRRDQGDRPRLQGSEMGCRGPATAPRRLLGVQVSGHASTAARQCQWTGHFPTTATRDPGDWPIPHGSQMGTRGPAMPPGKPRGPGERPRPNGGRPGPMEPATTQRGHPVPR